MNHLSGNSVRHPVSLFLFVSALVIIPFWFVWHILGVLETKETELGHRNASEELQEIAAHLARLAHPETAYRDFAERAARVVAWNGNLQALVAKWPADSVKLYLFDRNGKRVTRPGCMTGMAVASERVFGLIRRAANEGRFTLTAPEKRQVESFIGSHQMIPSLASRPNHLHDFAIIGISRYAGWYQVRGRSGGIAGHLLVVVEQRKIEPAMLAMRACATIGRLSGNAFVFGWLNQARRGASGLSDGSPLPASFAAWLSQIPAKPIVWGKQRLVALSDTADGIRLFGMRRKPVMSDFIPGLRSFLVVLLLELGLVTIWWRIFGGDILVPLRLQLLGWFGLSAIAGLAALIGFAQVYRDASQDSLIRTNRDAAVRLLQKTDGNFGPAFAPLAREYLQAARDLEGNPQNTASLAAKLAPMAKARQFAAAFLFGPMDSPRYKISATPDTEIGNFADEQPQFIQSLAQQAMDRFNAITDDPGDTSTSGARNMLNVLLARPVDRLIQQRGTLQSLTLNGVNATVFLELIGSSDGVATACMIVLHDTPALEARYLVNTSSSLARHMQHRLIALPKRTAGKLSAVPARGLRREPDLERLQELLDLTGATQHRLGRINGERTLITAVPGRVMPDYHLFLLTPFQPIDDQVRAVSIRITLLAVAGTGFSLFLAWMFGGSLLGPLRTLTAGIDRLVGMQLDDPVTVNTGDELQQIGAGITGIMEDLQERALAKTVQEQLLSGKPLAGPGWHAQGWSRSASDIGGEIFDMIQLNDGRVAVMVGDVAAHGISAALVMAMAKTAVRLFLDEPDATPTVVLSELDRYFRLHARRLSRIGMMLGIYDPATRLLRYAATGRLYPVFLTQDADPRLLAVDGDGLGAGSSGRARPEHQIGMAAGDRLVICTDGVIDACDPSGCAAGSSGICDLLDGLRHEPPDQLGSRLWEALNSWQGGRNPGDDQTVLVLASIPQEPGGGS